MVFEPLATGRVGAVVMEFSDIVTNIPTFQHWDTISADIGGIDPLRIYMENGLISRRIGQADR